MLLQPSILLIGIRLDQLLKARLLNEWAFSILVILAQGPTFWAVVLVAVLTFYVPLGPKYQNIVLDDI
jgi:hypothetical protein